MAQSKQPCAIPTSLSAEQFNEFVCPFLTEGRRGPKPKVALHTMFNYILRVLYLGCPWKELSIAHGLDGEPEIHYTRVYRQFRRWHDEGCFEVIFANSVFALHDSGLLDTSVVHGDGTTTAAKKGGDNLGFSGHKHLKGDKVVAICDRRCNVIAPFIAAPGNQNESPLMVPALTALTAIAKAIGLDLQGSIASFDGVYDSKANRKAIFNRGLVPNIPRIAEAARSPSAAASGCSMRTSSRNGSAPSSGCLPGKTSSADCCFASNASARCTTPSRPWPTR